MSYFNLRFTVEQDAALERMAGELRTSKADVVRRALALLEAVIREQKAGNQLTVSKDGKVIKEIVGVI